MKDEKRFYNINCLYCNTFYVAAKKATKFCSRSCGSKWNHENNSNFKHTKQNLTANRNIPKIEKECLFCKQTYYVQRKRRNKTKFCSAKCKSAFIYAQHKTVMIERARLKSTGRVAPNRGVPHTDEALEKILKSSMNRSVYKNMCYDRFIDKNGKEYCFKSSYEFAFCIDILEKQNINWVYEPRRFKLSNGKVYIPDFYDKDNDIFYEVKGYLTDKSKEKLDLFYKEYEQIKLKVLFLHDLVNMGVDLTNKRIKQIKKQYSAKVSHGEKKENIST